MRLIAYPERKSSGLVPWVGRVITENGDYVLHAEANGPMEIQYALGVLGYMNHTTYDKKFGKGNWTIEWMDELPGDLKEKMKDNG